MALTAQSLSQDLVGPIMALADRLGKNLAEDLVSDNHLRQDPIMLVIVTRLQSSEEFKPNISRVNPSTFCRRMVACLKGARIVHLTSLKQTLPVSFKSKSLRDSRLIVLTLMASGRWRKNIFTVKARCSQFLLRTTTLLLLPRKLSLAFVVLTGHHLVGKTLAVQLRMHCQDRRFKQIRTSSELQQVEAACETLVKVPQVLLSVSSSKFFLASTPFLCAKSRLMLLRREPKFLRVKSAKLSRKPAALRDPTDGYRNLSISSLRHSKVTLKG